MRTTTAPHESAPPLHAELRRFALQVQLGFTFTLALSLFMLVLQG